MTLWPITQFAPITIGKPGSVCSVELSWICERSPISIHSLSPRSTAPNQTLASALEPHAADQHRGLGDPVVAVGRKFRRLSVEFVDRHCAPSVTRADLATSERIGARRQATSWPSAWSAITTTVPDIRLQKPGDERRQRGEAEVAALDAAAADGVADDDEGRGEHQERHGRQRPIAFGLVQQAEARRLQGQELIAAGQQSRRPQSRSPAPAANAPNPTRPTQAPTIFGRHRHGPHATRNAKFVPDRRARPPAYR